VAPFRIQNKSPVPRRLRDARTRAGLSQAVLGTKAGLDPSVASTRVNQYERGVHNPGYPTMLKFAGVLDIPVAYFYCEDDRVAEVILGLGRLKDEDLVALQQWLAARQI
jgi:transcriptional regulator with XRE-family HTH domain